MDTQKVKEWCQRTKVTEADLETLEGAAFMAYVEMMRNLREKKAGEMRKRGKH